MRTSALVLLALLALSQVALGLQLTLNKVNRTYSLAPVAHKRSRGHHYHGRDIGFAGNTETIRVNKEGVRLSSGVGETANVVFSDEKYVTDVYLGGEGLYDGTKFTVAVDSTSAESIFFNQQCTGCESVLQDGKAASKADEYVCTDRCSFDLNGASSLAATNDNSVVAGLTYGGRVDLPFYPAHDNVRVNGELLTQAPVGMAFVVSDSLNEMQDTQGVLGLGWNTAHIPKVQLLEDLSATRRGLESKSFSLYLSENVNRLVLGERDGFFANGQTTTFANAGTITWALPLASASLNDEPVVFTKATNSLAHFDFTTRYIWVPTSVLADLSNQVTTKFSQVLKNSLLSQPFDCPEDWSAWPALKLAFGGNDREFSLGAHDWIEVTDEENKQCQSLVRDINLLRQSYYSYGNAGSSKTATLTLPTVIANAAGSDWFIGGAFLKKFYANFDAVNNKISLAPATVIPVSPLGISGPWRIAGLVLGALLFLATLIALLVLLKGVGKRDKVQTVSRPYVLQEVREYVGTPVQVVQSNLTPVQQPTRVYQSSQVQYRQPVTTATETYVTYQQPQVVTTNLQSSQVISSQLQGSAAYQVAGNEYRSAFR